MTRGAAGPSWRRYLRFWRPDIGADVDLEVQTHIESRVEELVARGSTLEAARAQALDEFGDVDAFRENLRAIDQRILERRARAEWWDLLGLELRHAVRRLARHRGFTIPAVATLALGLGAAVAVFTLLDAVVLQPLPYAGADRLVRIESPVPGVGPDTRWGISKAELFYFRRESIAFEEIGLYQISGATLGATGESRQAERGIVALVTAGVHDVLRLRPVLGRPIVADDNVSREPLVVLLGHEMWQRRFGGDSGVVGGTLMVDGKAVRIVGVLGPDAGIPEELALSSSLAIDLWMPLWADPAQNATPQHTFNAIGRMKDDLPLRVAQDDLTRLTARLSEEFPSIYSQWFFERLQFSTLITPLRDDVLGGIGPVLWTLLGSVMLVLLIAVANVANLFLVRTQLRSRETSIRAALGAGRVQLLRHFLIETIVLALVAATLGMLLAHLGLTLLVHLAPPGIPRLAEVHIGARSAGVAALFVLGVGLALALLPFARSDHVMLGAAGRGLTASKSQHSTRRALVVAQVALSLVLLAAGGLLVESFRRLTRVHPGFESKGVVTLRVLLPDGKYESPASVSEFYRELAERVARLPDVHSIGPTNALPLAGEIGCSGVVFEGASQPAEDRACVPIQFVGPGYFRTLGARVRGREIALSDLQQGPGAIVVSEAFAKRFWPGEDPIGKRVGMGNAREMREVVGVVNDIRAAGLDNPPTEGVYASMFPVSMSLTSGRPPRSMIFAIRARSGDPLALVPAVRRIVAGIDAEVPVSDVRMLSDIVARSVARVSFSMWLLGIAAAIALLLSAVGIYGVVSYIVASQRAEIGIRMALGAREAEVGRAVVAQTLRLATVGVVLGLVGTVAGTRVLRTLLFEVSPTDLRILAAVSGLLLVLSVAASYGPARRAMSIAPVDALRHD